MKIYVIAFLAGCVLTMILGKFVLAELRKLKAGQEIRQDGPTWHNSKAGTPTMGGIAFILGSGIVTFACGWQQMMEGNFAHLYVYLFALIFGLIGFVDDYRKVRQHQNEGLTAKQKFVLQLLAAKINRRSLTELVSSEGMIDSVVSVRDVTTELIVQYVRAMESAAGSQIKTLHRLVGGAVEALEFHVDKDVTLADTPLRDLKLKPGVLIAGIVRRNGTILIPGGNDAICVGDDVIVVTQDAALQDIHDILSQD